MSFSKYTPKYFSLLESIIKEISFLDCSLLGVE